MRDADVLEGADGSEEGAAAIVEREISCGQQAEIMHGLNNVLVSIMLNAQLIGWKLPSYSRLRRNVHEIERSAQRAGKLLKRLMAEERLRENPATCIGAGGANGDAGMPSGLHGDCD
jgi:hypothetical protein